MHGVVILLGGVVPDVEKVIRRQDGLRADHIIDELLRDGVIGLALLYVVPQGPQPIGRSFCVCFRGQRSRGTGEHIDPVRRVKIGPFGIPIYRYLQIRSVPHMPGNQAHGCRIRRDVELIFGALAFDLENRTRIADVAFRHLARHHPVTARVVLPGSRILELPEPLFRRHAAFELRRVPLTDRVAEQFLRLAEGRQRHKITIVRICHAFQAPGIP